MKKHLGDKPFRSGPQRPLAAITPIAVACATLMMTLTAAQAQTTETVVVTGIRSSIENSIAIKRNSDNIVEAVTAEDLGKLPDLSIAESLARLPGLAGQRVNGNTTNIQIRGLSAKYGVTLLNGREMVSGGSDRSVEFDQFPAELLSGATVYKTPNASLGTQGLSGTVNMMTVRPLDMNGRQMVFGARYEENSNGTQIPGVSNKGNRISASYVDQFNNRTLGVALGVAHLESPEQQQHYENWWWSNMAQYSWCGAGCATPGVDADAVALQGFEATAFSTKQVRDGLMGVIEYKPNKDLHTVVDLYYSQFSKKYVGREFQEDGFNMWSGTTITNAGYANWDGQKVLVSGGAQGLSAQVLSRRNRRDDTIAAVGVNNELKLGSWTSVVDLSYSKADRDEVTAEMYAQPTSGANASFSSFQIERNGVSQFVPSQDWSDPLYMQLKQIWGQMGAARVFKVSDEMQSLRVAGKKDLEWGPFSRFEGGLNYAKRSKDYRQDKTAYDLASGATSAPIPSGVLMAPATLGFGSIPKVVNFDVQALLDTGMFTSRADDLSSAPGRVWGVKETVTTAYGMLNIDTTVGGMALRGNTGLQVVNAQQDSTGIRWFVDPVTDVGSGTPFSAGKSYTDVLPSLNLALELSSDTMLRLGLARTLARPNLEDMRAGIANPSRGRQPQGNKPFWSTSGGNPWLEPWRADSLDVSLEKYVGKRTYFSVAGFIKDLKSSVYKQDVFYDFHGYPDPCKPTATEQCMPLDPTNPAHWIGTLNAPSNGKGGWVRGSEFAASVDMGRFVPALDGFGFSASANFVKSNIHQDNDQNKPLEGMSGTTTSLVAFYEKNGFQARVGQRTRSRYLAAVRNIWGDNTVTTIEPETITDFQVGYSFESGPMKGFSVMFEVNNANNEPYRTMGSADNSSVPGLLFPTKYDRYGRQYLLGVSYKL